MKSSHNSTPKILP